jgi:hypothetical protein
VARVQAKAAYEANRPTEPTYRVDPTDSVFDTAKYEEGENEQSKYENGIKPTKAHKKKKNKLSKLKVDATETTSDSNIRDEQVTVADLG